MAAHQQRGMQWGDMLLRAQRGGSSEPCTPTKRARRGCGNGCGHGCGTVSALQLLHSPEPPGLPPVNQAGRSVLAPLRSREAEAIRHTAVSTGQRRCLSRQGSGIHKQGRGSAVAALAVANTRQRQGLTAPPARRSAANATSCSAAAAVTSSCRCRNVVATSSHLPLRPSTGRDGRKAAAEAWKDVVH